MQFVWLRSESNWSFLISFRHKSHSTTAKTHRRLEDDERKFRSLQWWHLIAEPAEGLVDDWPHQRPTQIHDGRDFRLQAERKRRESQEETVVDVGTVDDRWKWVEIPTGARRWTVVIIIMVQVHGNIRDGLKLSTRFSVQLNDNRLCTFVVVRSRSVKQLHKCT